MDSPISLKGMSILQITLYSPLIYCMFYYECLEVGRNSWASNVLFWKPQEFQQAPKCDTSALSHPELISGRMEYKIRKWDCLSLPTETSLVHLMLLHPTHLPVSALC